MKNAITTLYLLSLLPVAAHAEGFTDADVLFYGQVRQVGGAHTVLLQAGALEITLANQHDATNSVTLSTSLRPTGTGDTKLYSYSLHVPLKYLPDPRQKSAYLSIGAQEVDFKIQNITIDGRDATLPDGSLEFYALGFASRSSQHRLDLLVDGGSTDSDGDGLPDWWETQNGLDPDNPADAAADLDGDGWSNLDEFNRGSSPSQSNTEPQLVTAELLVPESGEAGLLVQVLDSDTLDADINIALAGGEGRGFEIKLDGTLLDPSEAQNFSLTDLQSGRLTVAHTDRAVSQFALPISWDDGGESSSGQLLVRVATPSSEDGNDAALWLDGHDLPAAGTPIGNWPDRSGNDRDAMQPLADHQPVVTDRSADFTASATAHLFFQDGALAVGDHTVLAAYRPAESSDETQTLLASNRGFLQLAATTQAVSYPGAPHYQMDGLAVRGYQNSSRPFASLAVNRSATSIFRREADLLQNIFGISYDGENVIAEPIDPVLPTLGARRPAIPDGSDPVDDPFGGQLHELLVFPTALPEQKLRDVHDYLQSKWGDAIIWDLSTELKSITLSTTGSGRHIIRGGHGDDVLGGGSQDDTISGGPGADTLTGGGGTDHFVFGGVDTGRDVIIDFDLEKDVVDLSALFWGKSGDARPFLAVRLDTNFATSIPTIDSVLLVQRPDGSEQEIVLRDRVVGATQLIQLIVEGRIRMGGLSIPMGVQLALAEEDSPEPLRESLDQPITIELTRSGGGVAAALDVPIGFFEDALGEGLVLEGVSDAEGDRAVVRFERGETRKSVTLRPIPDLETEGAETWQVAVLPQYRYTVGGAPAERIVEDIPNLWLEVVQANAVVEPAQPARVRIHRDGELAQSMAVELQLGGTAQEGVHIGTVPGSITIPAGEASLELQIGARAEGLLGGPKVVLLQLAAAESHQLGNPHEALLYVAMTAEEANAAGFDRWLTASTDGEITSLSELMERDPDSFGRRLRAYAFGREIHGNPIALRLVGGRPEITATGVAETADIRWGVQASADLRQWAAAGDAFVEVEHADGLRLMGEPLAPDEKQKIYRLELSLDPGLLAGASITALTGADRYGISGAASWKPEAVGGDLVGEGGPGWLIAQVSGPMAIEFEMELLGGGADDSLAFYIDGVRVSHTAGESVRVIHDLTVPGEHLLMWEFAGGTGRVGIRDL